MDSSQTSSFIPKSPVRGTVVKRKVRKVYVFTYIIYIVFLGVLIAAGFVWFLKAQAQSNLQTVQQTLLDEKDKFRQSDMTMVLDLSKRLSEAHGLVNQQVSLGLVFSALEKTTIAPVTLSGMTYEKAESAKLLLTLTARASDFNAALYQRQVLSTNEVLAGAKITNVQYGVQETTGDDSAQVSEMVTFTIEKDLDPQAVPSQVGTTLSTQTTPVTSVNDSTTDFSEEVLSADATSAAVN